MTNKKSENGNGMGPSPISRKPRSETTKKRTRVSTTKTSKQTGAVGSGPSITELQGTTSDELYGEIAKRAYELYERRGWHHGQDVTDWLEAEKQVLSQKSLAKA